MDSGSVKGTFALVASRVREVHLRDLFDASYPWRELFALLAAQHYEGFTLAEIPESTDPERVLRYFKALWLSFQPGAASSLSPEHISGHCFGRRLLVGSRGIWTQRSDQCRSSR